MNVGTRFPPEWLLKKSREECEELKKKNALISKENLELRRKVLGYESDPKTIIKRDELYQNLIKQNKALESKYSKARKAIADIHKIASSVSESSDAVSYMDDICNIIINFYRNNRNGNTDN